MRNKIFVCFLLLFSFTAVTARGIPGNTVSESRFNDALNYYQQEDYEKSLELLRSSEMQLDEKYQQYKLMLTANSLYQLSRELADSGGDTPKALEDIDSSISLYERILELDISNKNAAHNLELAMKLKDKIQTKHEEEQREQEKNQSDQEKIDDLQQKQQKLSEDSQKGADDHKTDQEETAADTSELKDEMKSSDPALNEKIQNAENAQQKALEAIENRDYDKAGQYQEEAARNLEEASEILSGEPSENKADQIENQSEKQSDEIAQSIINNENDRESSSEMSGNGLTVDRNW